MGRGLEGQEGQEERLSKTRRLALASVLAAGVSLADRVDAHCRAATVPVTLEAEIRAAGALRGEPHTVSAAAVMPSGASDVPLITIENPAAFDVKVRRRLVIVGGLDGDDAGA